MQDAPYPLLFSEWQIRNTTMPNRIVFAPTCPTWVADPLEGVFTDQAVAYYEERAKAGVGLIIIGGTIIDRESLYSEFNFPGLWNDEQVEALAKVADAVHRARLQTRRAASSRRSSRDAGVEEGSGLRRRRGVVPRGAEPGAARRVPERADAEGARGARDRGPAPGLRGRGLAGGRRRPRRRRVPHVARLPALAVPLAALQPSQRPLGRLLREPPALPRRGTPPDPGRRSAPSRFSATGSTRLRSGPAISRWTTSSVSSSTSRRRQTSTT